MSKINQCYLILRNWCDEHSASEEARGYQLLSDLEDQTPTIPEKNLSCLGELIHDLPVENLIVVLETILALTSDHNPVLVRERFKGERLSQAVAQLGDRRVVDLVHRFNCK